MSNFKPIIMKNIIKMSAYIGYKPLKNYFSFLNPLEDSIKNKIC